MTTPKQSPLPWKTEPCGDDRCGWPQIIAADKSEVVVSHRLMSERKGSLPSRGLLWLW